MISRRSKTITRGFILGGFLGIPRFGEGIVRADAMGDSDGEAPIARKMQKNATLAWIYQGYPE